MAFHLKVRGQCLKTTRLLQKISLSSIEMALLTLCELNTENLFISLEHHDGGSFENMSEGAWRKLALPQMRRKQKPLRKLWRMGATIGEIDPDVLMLVEVGGKESLQLFNQHFLESRYAPYILDSNSPRGIDLAFLLKKDLNYDVEIISNREMPIDVQTYQGGFAAKFSRDVAELHLSQNSELKLILLLTHLKSKISSDRDFQGTDRRKAEAAALAGLYDKLQKKYPHTPIIVGGDLNAELSSPELEPLTKTNLTDFHDVMGTAKEDRVSFVHFDYKGLPHPQTLDYLLLSPELKDKVQKDKSSTYHYRSFFDIPHPLPRTVSERYQMPSDHYPLVLTLDL
jgi:endonuclease/exonuclease/phosphatase family metal-dependent hydrolase